MAIDPFSGASKPMPPAALLEPRGGLPFAATLQGMGVASSSEFGAGVGAGLLPAFAMDDGGVLPSEGGRAGRAFKRSTTEWATCGGQSSAGGRERAREGQAELNAFARLGFGRPSASTTGTGYTGAGAWDAPRPLPLRAEDRPAVGSDAWMEGRIAALVDGAGYTLDLGGCGLTALSPKIADLQHLVTFGSARGARSPSGFGTAPTASPFAPHSQSQSHSRHASGSLAVPSASPAGPSTSRSPAASPAYPSSPAHLDATRLSPFAASSRTFSRIVSAPVSSPSSPAAGGARANESLQRMAHHRAMLGGSPGVAAGSSAGSASRASPNGLYDAPRRPRESLPFTAPEASRGASGSFDPPGSPVPDPPALCFPAALGVSPSSPVDRARTRSTREFARTASGSMEPVDAAAWSGKGRGQVELYLANNQLEALPSALFQATNLVVLSVRSNRLTELPAAVGTLRDLRNLNVSMNRLKYFPPAILDLSLDEFLYASNNLLPCPPDVDANTYPSKRLLGPLKVNDAGFPSLRSLCLSQLLSPRRADGLPPLLSAVDWEPEAGSREPHGLQDAATLHSSQSHLSMRECERITACLRSAVQASRNSRRIKDGIPHPAFSPAARRSADKETIAMGSDDASLNPYYSACPSPHHTDGREGDSSGPKITRRIYLHDPAEERMEWVKIKGADSLVPIRWQGCQRGCLDFLEQPEVVQETEEDGFDVAVLEED